MGKAPQAGQKVLVVVKAEEKVLHKVRALVLVREERKVPVSKTRLPILFLR